MINTTEKIKIFDDTGSGDDFISSKILYENDEIILCEVENEWYEKPLTVMIYKNKHEVCSKELMFYLAENY